MPQEQSIEDVAPFFYYLLASGKRNGAGGVALEEESCKKKRGKGGIRNLCPSSRKDRVYVELQPEEKDPDIISGPGRNSRPTLLEYGHY